MKVKCSEIKVGERVRKDLGDIDSLASDIEKVGLLQPIGITKNYELVFGGRRLEACKLLNYEEIEVVTIDSDKALECEALENVSRKNFVMSERVAIRKALKEEETKKRNKSMAKGTQIGKLPIQWTKKRLAKITGVSLRTADKENYIVKHGDQNTINKVDENELSVSKAYNLVKKEKEKAKAVSENIDNEADTLSEEDTPDIVPSPIQEFVVEQESIDTSSSLDQLNITAYSPPGVYVINIVLPNEYDITMYPISSINELRYHAKKIGIKTSDCLIKTATPAYENYIIEEG